MTRKGENAHEALVEELKTLLAQQEWQRIRARFDATLDADFADAVEHLSEKELRAIFSALDAQDAADVVEELEPEAQSAVVEALAPEVMSGILDEMQSDEAADLIGDLPPEEAEQLLGLMDTAEARDVRELLQYGEETAGGIMATEFIALNRHLTAQEVIDRLRALEPDAEAPYYLYVIDEQGRLLGVLSLRQLLVAPPHRRIGEIMSTSVVKVGVHEDQEEVVQLMKKYNLLALPVVDEEGQLVGVVTHDDAMEVLEQEVEEDLYALAGTSEETERERSPFLLAARRMQWIVMGLVGELIAGRIIAGYQHRLAAMLSLGFFIPVVMATGGYVASQSFATIIRGLATGELRARTLGGGLLRESVVGVLIGLASGLLVGLAAQVWVGEPILGLIVGSSLSLVAVFAAVSGTLVPLIFHWLHKDPALASGPFIQTLNDATGMAIYFTLASVWLRGA
ncbi:MAG TPA: magnesium transporter [Armatimonadetes bacterium]|nr:magnesium transporter [Armatimonadota bacterium]